MPDDVIAQHREAAAAAIEAGDSAAANRAYQAELQALAGAEPGDDADAGDEPEHDDDADTLPEDGLVDEDEPVGPVGVEHTDAIYREFREHFDDHQADQLRAAWGDRAVEYSALAGALAADANLAPIVSANMTDTGAVTAQGALAALDALRAAGVPAAVLNDPHLAALVRERMDDYGSLSPAGARIALAHVARKWGYKFSRRPSPRASTSTSTSTKEPRTMPMIEAELKKDDELRAVREQIEQAQARGDSRRANLLYRTEQALIARQRGNRPIVNGRRTA